MLQLLPKQPLRIYAVGFLMGLADLVPGISGGTIALLGGIYGRLIIALSGVRLTTLKLLLKGQWRQAWLQVDAGFLLVLLAGIFSALFSMAKLIHYLIQEQAILINSLFLGLIITTSLALIKELNHHNSVRLGFLVLGILVSVTLGYLPMKTGLFQVSGWQYIMIFGAGSLAITAMILPGVSGSFILLLLGMYSLIIASIANLNIDILVTFACGCALGLIVASRAITWLLRHQMAATMSFLIGLMMGSANKLWPWKHVLSYRLNSSGEQVPIVQENLLPWDFSSMTGNENHMVGALLVFIMSAFLVWFLGRVKLDRLDD